jgi:hypothetical protein
MAPPPFGNEIAGDGGIPPPSLPGAGVGVGSCFALPGRRSNQTRHCELKPESRRPAAAKLSGYKTPCKQSVAIRIMRGINVLIVNELYTSSRLSANQILSALGSSLV